MKAMFHEVLADMNHPTAWWLGKVLCRGKRVDLGELTAGRPFEPTGALTVDMKSHGEPMELSFTLREVPVVTSRTADLIDQMAPGAVERFPIDVEGIKGRYEVLNVVRVLDAVDRDRSVYNLWKPEDGRPDKTGDFRGIDRMVLRDDLPQDVGIFRPAGWTVALIVSSRLKRELEKIGSLCARFLPIDGGSSTDQTDALRPHATSGAKHGGREERATTRSEPTAQRRNPQMDMSTAFDDVLRIATEAKDARNGWDALIRYLEAHTTSHSLGALRRTDIDDDIERVREQLQRVLRREPPTMKLNALWFGLFDTAIPNGPDGIGYYVAGLEHFDPEVPDSRCQPAWWPEGRSLRSVALEMVKVAENAAAAANREAERQLLSYGGQLGAALLVSRFAALDLLPELRRVVGFDSGDFAEIAVAG